jgi:hypothetical protein
MTVGVEGMTIPKWAKADPADKAVRARKQRAMESLVIFPDIIGLPPKKVLLTLFLVRTSIKF